MHTLASANSPQSDESLSSYLRRIRTEKGMSQKDLANVAGIHLQSLGKIERDRTTRLNKKTLQGLAYALSIPVEYLDAVNKGIPVESSSLLKFCPSCWIPGTAPNPAWTLVSAKYCLLCGTLLMNRCASCNEPLSSLKFRFCPYCGSSYKPATKKAL